VYRVRIVHGIAHVTDNPVARVNTARGDRRSAGNMQSISIKQCVTRFHARNIQVICQQDVHLPVFRHCSDIFITRSRILSQATA
ncbi:hypothetical protein DLO46_27235, partial [Salmonella enterica]|nr:hypothetical protein [Salmonella enterica]EBK4147822.1 hypothetical protein [Salmonella enterica]